MNNNDLKKLEELFKDQNFAKKVLLDETPENARELLKEKGIKGVEVSSAGTSVSFSSGASYNSIMTMAKKNIDLTSHTSRMLTDGMLSAADAVYTMTRSQAAMVKRMFPGFSGKVRPLAERDITDPFGGDLDEYQTCADEIYAGLLNILGGL